jgi:microsomal dipeptidase-like Zn-dependent dipeptidase
VDHPRNVPDDVLRSLAVNGGVVMVNFAPGYVDHVGLGSDFDGIEDVPVGLEGVDRYPALLAELMRRGWTDADIAKVAGENVLRVMAAAEAGAERLRVVR